MFQALKEYISTTLPLASQAFQNTKNTLEKQAASMTEATANFFPTYEDAYEKVNNSINYSKETAQTISTFSLRQIRGTRNFIENASLTQTAVILTTAATAAFVAGNLTANFAGNHTPTAPTTPKPAPASKPVPAPAPKLVLTPKPVPAPAPKPVLAPKLVPTGPVPTTLPTTTQATTTQPTTATQATTTQPTTATQPTTTQPTTATQTTTTQATTLPTTTLPTTTLPTTTQATSTASTDFCNQVINSVTFKDSSGKEHNFTPSTNAHKSLSAYCNEIMTGSIPESEFQIFDKNTQNIDLYQILLATKYITDKGSSADYCSPLQKLYNQEVKFPSATTGVTNRSLAKVMKDYLANVGTTEGLFGRTIPDTYLKSTQGQYFKKIVAQCGSISL